MAGRPIFPELYYLFRLCMQKQHYNSDKAGASDERDAPQDAAAAREEVVQGRWQQGAQAAPGLSSGRGGATGHLVL